MITNKPNIGKYILSSGVDRIFIDLEVLGKKDRQKNLNTWKSSHQKEDISEMRKNIKKKNILVRLNPWNNNSPFEIDYAIRNGADYLMLPMIKSFKEISTFCQIVNFRVPVIPLIETDVPEFLVFQLVPSEEVKIVPPAPVTTNILFE